MIKIPHSVLPAAAATLIAFFIVVTHVSAQPAQQFAPSRSAVSLSASATASIPNDRMLAWMRAEADNADPAAGYQRAIGFKQAINAEFYGR